MKTSYINPLTVMRLESARGITGDTKLPTIEQYNKAVSDKLYVGRKIDAQTDAVAEPTAKNTEVGKKVEISEKVVEKHKKNCLAPIIIGLANSQ